MSGSEISLISLPISDMLDEKEQKYKNKYTLFSSHSNSYYYTMPWKYQT